MRRTTGLGIAGSSRTMARSSRVTNGGILRAALLAALELEHQPPEQRVQLALLVLGERGGDERLLGRLGADRVLPGLAAGIGQLDENAAAVVGVRDASHEPGLLEPVDPVRHRAAR